MRARGWLVLVVALACGVLATGLRAAGDQKGRLLREDWQAVYLGGQKAGYAMSRVRETTASGKKVYVSTLWTEISIARAGTPLKLTSGGSVTEDAEGRVLSFQFRDPMSKQTQGTLEGGKFVIRSGGPHGSFKREIDPPDALGPHALERVALEKGFEPGTSYTLRAFLPQSPAQAAVMSFKVGPVEEVRVFDVTRRLHRVDSTISIMPGATTTAWIDGDGTTWLARTPMMPGMVMEMRKTAKAVATADVEPAEMFTQSLVRPNRPIANPRSLGKLRLLVTPLEEGAALPAPPSGPCQTVHQTPNGWLVEIRQAAPPEHSYEIPYAGNEWAACLRPNRWLESEDEVVQDLARQAVGGTTDAVMAARRIERFVYGRIQDKNLGVGMASAAETARSLTGDCSEHSFLAAAIARAVGIPGRVVGGLVYVPGLGGGRGAFGYHMWTEVYVGSWVPIDASMPGHDATHLALTRSDLNEGEDAMQMSGDIFQFMGKVRLQIVETSEESPPAGKD